MSSPSAASAFGTKHGIVQRGARCNGAQGATGRKVQRGFRLDLAALLTPEAEEGGLVIPHNDAGVRAADESVAP